MQIHRGSNNDCEGDNDCSDLQTAIAAMSDKSIAEVKVEAKSEEEAEDEVKTVPAEELDDAKVSKNVMSRRAKSIMKQDNNVKGLVATIDKATEELQSARMKYIKTHSMTDEEYDMEVPSESDQEDMPALTSSSCATPPMLRLPDGPSDAGTENTKAYSDVEKPDEDDASLLSLMKTSDWGCERREAKKHTIEQTNAPRAFDTDESMTEIAHYIQKAQTLGESEESFLLSLIHI